MSNLELVLRFITSYSLAMLKPRPMHLEPVHLLTPQVAETSQAAWGRHRQCDYGSQPRY